VICLPCASSSRLTSYPPSRAVAPGPVRGIVSTLSGGVILALTFCPYLTPRAFHLLARPRDGSSLGADSSGAPGFRFPRGFTTILQPTIVPSVLARLRSHFSYWPIGARLRTLYRSQWARAAPYCESAVTPCLPVLCRPSAAPWA